MKIGSFTIQKLKQKWKTRNGQNFNGFELRGTQ